LASPHPCYLDNSATTRPFDEVIDAMARAMAEAYYNPSAAYPAGVAVEDELNRVRGVLLAALRSRGRVVFTSGGTEADNLAILGTVRNARARFVTSAVEHPAAARAFEELKARGHDVAVLPVDGRCMVSADAVADAVGEDTALVSVMHVNNETGAIQDIAALAAAARRKNPAVLFHSDGVQAFLRAEAEPERWGVGLYTVSAHKIHGPKGAGALYAGDGVRLDPRMLGGGQEGGLRSGTENVPGIVGFGRAVEVFSAELEKRRAALMDMKLALAARLLAIEGAAVNGPEPGAGAPHILNVSFDGVRGEVLLRALAEQGVYVSTGSACGARQNKPSATLVAMGLERGRVEGAIRLSLSPLNAPGDIDRAADAIASQVKRLRAFKRR
jgi:cysteine desulfurase